MKPPRGLSADEAAAWDRVAATVAPLHPSRPAKPSPPVRQEAGAYHVAMAQPHPVLGSPQHRHPAVTQRPRHPIPGAHHHVSHPGLDGHWERRIKGGTLVPDFTLDLHGHTLDSAHGRLMDGMHQARALGARVVLLIAGKPRPVEAADRGTQRGAIRAKVLDWLAASSHAPAIAAIRKAHIRHGGEGALYIVLRKR